MFDEDYNLAYDAVVFYGIFCENFPACESIYKYVLDIVADYKVKEES